MPMIIFSWNAFCSRSSFGVDYFEMQEVSANKAQYSVDPKTIEGGAASINQINLRYLANLKNERGEYVYPTMQQKWQSLPEPEKKKYE